MGFSPIHRVIFVSLYHFIPIAPPWSYLWTTIALYSFLALAVAHYTGYVRYRYPKYLLNIYCISTVSTVSTVSTIYLLYVLCRIYIGRSVSYILYVSYMCCVWCHMYTSNAPHTIHC